MYGREAASVQRIFPDVQPAELGIVQEHQAARAQAESRHDVSLNCPENAPNADVFGHNPKRAFLP
jgi:hypothetical protein